MRARVSTTHVTGLDTKVSGLKEGLMNKYFCIGCISLLPVGVSAAQIDISIGASGPSSVFTADPFTISVFFSTDDFGPGAFAAAGLDVIVTGATAITPATILEPWTTGARSGTVNGLTLERVVMGQINNIFDQNPGVNTDLVGDLFTMEITPDLSATEVVIDIEVAAGGGVRVFPDANDGASIDTARGEAGSSLTFQPLVVTIIPSAPSAGLLALGGLAAVRRRR